MLVIDQQITNRLTALIDSTTQGLSMVPTEAFSTALTTGCDRCAAAKAELTTASQAMEQDKRENAAAAAAHADAIAVAIDELSVLGADVRNRLLNLRAAERTSLGSAELSRRATFLRDAFDMAPSRIEDLGRTVAKDKLHEALQTLDGSAWVNAEELSPLRSAVTAVDETHAAVVMETLDDEAILDALVRARTIGQRRAVSQRQLIAGVLGHEDLPLSVDDFVLRTAKATAAAPPSDSADAPAPSPIDEPEAVTPV